MAKLWSLGKSLQKISLQTVDEGKNKSDEKLNEHIKKLEGCPELLIEKFEDLFNRSRELFKVVMIGSFLFFLACRF